MPSADRVELLNARTTIATLQAALSRAHEQLRESQVTIATLNQRLELVGARIEQAEFILRRERQREARSRRDRELAAQDRARAAQALPQVPIPMP